MGWFSFFDAFTEIVEEFSSPLGDGLVLIDCSKAENYFAFSSPSGDGLVRVGYL